MLKWIFCKLICLEQSTYLVYLWPTTLKVHLHCRSLYAKTSAISPSLLALATLGSVTQIGSFLLAKASKEGNIGSPHRAKLRLWKCVLRRRKSFITSVPCRGTTWSWEIRKLRRRRWRRTGPGTGGCRASSRRPRGSRGSRTRRWKPGTVFRNTPFYPDHTHGHKKLERLPSLGWKGLPVSNTLTFSAHS